MSSTPMSTTLKRAAAVAASFACLATVAACGSSDDESSTAATATSAAPTTATTAGGVEEVTFDSAESKLPDAYPEPTPEPGFTWKLGWLLAGPNAYLTTVTEAGKREAERLGAEVTVLDASYSLDKQLSHCNQLVAQKVDAITVSPLDPKALTPCLTRAEKAGIAIVGQDSPPYAGEPPAEGMASTVTQGTDEARYLLAKAAAEAKPGGTFALLGAGVPVAILQYGMERQKYWAERFGLTFEARVDDRTLTPDGAATAMNTILSQHPDVDVVFAYDDGSAQAASITARASGKTGIAFYGNSGESSAIDMVKSGQLAGTVLIGATDVGKQVVWGLYDLLTEQHLPLPPQVAPKNTLVLEGNADAVTPLGGDQ